MTESKGPAEQAVDLVVFAPIGFALEARNLLPTFVERGRQQVMMAKMVGRFAVTHGQTIGKDRLSKAQAQAESIMAELGLVQAAPARRPETSTNGALQGAQASGEPARSSAAPEPAGPARAAQSSAASADLAIADYDSLAASQVIPRLAGLDPDELEAVRVYESAHRARKTILGKIAQLQGN